MKKSVVYLLFFMSTGAYARSDLKPVMATICEQLGDAQGVECVKLQRRLENDNALIDENGAGICSLILQVGSINQNSKPVGDMVLSCFKQVSNLKISDEVRDTCNGPVYLMQGSAAPMSVLQAKVKKMMECIRQLGITVRAHKVH